MNLPLVKEIRLILWGHTRGVSKPGFLTSEKKMLGLAKFKMI
ncbi:hypothetical protein GXM_08341 [Nostoc sphaeroides CCNUC1]|uniref:Uncharacterized protein n=1 Tax=Nostoc sphaeroides CCNUC1 TaxID=2653204 RepID=A0A5P8WDE9_9NOSO|nr:hypothetical protein GXM_08341 [Nostoc sphaeroides CCNUC1]